MTKQLNQITDTLIETMQEVKSKKTTINIGNSVSRLAGTAIKTIIINTKLSLRQQQENNKD